MVTAAKKMIRCVKKVRKSSIGTTAITLLKLKNQKRKKEVISEGLQNATGR